MQNGVGPSPLHLRIDVSGACVRVNDDAPWVPLQEEQELRGVGTAEGLFHSKTQKLSQVFVECCRALLADRPSEAAARTLDDLESKMVGMRAEIDGFMARFGGDTLLVVNHLELAYRAAYRQLLYSFDQFRSETGLSKDDILSAMIMEYPDLRDDFPKFHADVVPVDLTERSARERYGALPEEPGYVRQVGHYLQKNWKTFFPPLLWVPEYQLTSLPWDLIAGVTIGIFGVAQGLAYALLAGLPPQLGLYTLTVPVFLYTFLGTSRQLAMGPFALIALLVAGSLDKVTVPAGLSAAAAAAFKVQVSVNLMLYCGMFLLIFGILRLGFISNFISKPFLSGFTSAAGLTIQTSQLAKLFGLTGPTQVQLFMDQLIQFFRYIPTTHWPSLLSGLISMALLIVMQMASDHKWIKIRGKAVVIPGALIVTVLGILISWAADLHGYGIKVIGVIPGGFNPISMPTFDNFSELFLDALILALIVYLTSATIVIRYAEEHHYATDSNQELVAYGVCNVVGSFFTGFVVTGAMSRSAVANMAGARSQIYSLVTGLVVVLVLMVLTGVLYYSPQPVLAATIIMAAYSLWDFSLLPQLWRVRKSDFLVWWVAFLCTLFLGSQTGLLLSMAFSIVLVVYRASTPHVATLGRLPQSTVWRDVTRFPEALCVDGLLVVRFDADYFFANVAFIHREIVARVNAESERVHVLILDLSTVADLDFTAATELKKTLKWLQDQDVKLLLVSVTGRVRDCMKHAGVLDMVGSENIFWLHQDAARVAKDIIAKANAGHAPPIHRDSSVRTLMHLSQFGTMSSLSTTHEQGKRQKSFLERII